jgi:GDP-mannose 6-dehydrogenase
MIKAGKSPIVEEGIQELVSTVVRSGRVTVTDDAAQAIAATDLSFVCVGTPSVRNGDQDLNAIRRVCEQIADALAGKDEFHTVVIRSTVRPGTTDEVVRTILEKHSKKKAGSDFGLCFQPEFLREGSSIKDYDTPPFTVVGSDSQRAVDVVRSLFSALPSPFVATDVRTAEMLKYACNAFHALKITFANEVGRLSQAVGVNSHEVMRLVCQDQRLNISPAYLRPGFSFGGSCLPKDLRALLYMGKRHDVDIPMLGGILQSNQVHLRHGIDLVMRQGRKTIGMIGLSFKPGTDDLRESPLVEMAEYFIGKGLTLKIYDPEVNLSRLMGANRAYIEETIPHVASLMVDDHRQIVSESDVIVLGRRDPAVVQDLLALTNSKQMVLDLANLEQSDRLAAQYVGVCW